MKLFYLLVAFLSSLIEAFSMNQLKVDEQILKPNMCLQLKKGKTSRYISHDSEILRVLEIIESEQNQIIVQSIQTDYFDYIDIKNVRLINCPQE